jgi:hypothetical protein
MLSAGLARHDRDAPHPQVAELGVGHVLHRFHVPRRGDDQHVPGLCVQPDADAVESGVIVVVQERVARRQVLRRRRRSSRRTRRRVSPLAVCSWTPVTLRAALRAGARQNHFSVQPCEQARVKIARHAATRGDRSTLFRPVRHQAVDAEAAVLTRNGAQMVVPRPDGGQERTEEAGNTHARDPLRLCQKVAPPNRPRSFRFGGGGHSVRARRAEVGCRAEALVASRAGGVLQADAGGAGGGGGGDDKRAVRTRPRVRALMLGPTA